MRVTPDTDFRAPWIAAAILLGALGLRVGFVLTMPDTPLYWDEPHYDTWAEVHRGFWSSLVSGGEGPSLGDAFRASRQKGEVFVGMVGAIYALIGRHPRAIFVLQAMLDTLTCLLLFDLTRVLAGVRAGLVALALAALYEPFTFAAARLQTETLAALLYVAGLWAICVPGRRRAWRYVAGGVLFAAAMLTKPALQYLPLALLPAIVAANWDRHWRERLRAAGLVGAGCIAGLAPHLLLAATAGAGAQSAGMHGNGSDLYAGVVYVNAGWKSAHLAFAPPPDALVAVLGGDPQRRPTEADYRAAFVRTLTTEPLESAAVMLHKLYAAWRYPYNDSRASLLLGRDGVVLLHRVILCLALLGMPLALRHWRVAMPLLAATLYLWLVYLSVKIETRYAVTAMPMMICFAGVAVAALSRGWEQAWRTGDRRRLLLAAGAAAMLLALASAASIARLLEWLPIGPEAANGLRVAAILGTAVACGWLAAELARPEWGRSAARAAAATSFAIVALVVVAGRPLAQDWREWRSTLRPGGAKVAQQFALPAGLPPPLGAALAIDMLPEPAQGDYDVVVQVNGAELKRYRGAPIAADANLPHGSHDLLYQVRQPSGEANKAWYVIPVPAELIAAGAPVAVEVALEGAATGGSLVVFGDHSSDPATYVGPSLFSPRNDADTSIFKYLADGDSRLRRRMPLAGTAHARFHDGSGWSDRDLALDAGRQQGRYRIFLVLSYPRGVVVL